MNTKLHFSSKSYDWATPQALFDGLNVRYGPFDLDVCASAGNAKVAQFFTAEQDGLKQSWADSFCWMNPPYGREISKWVKKAYEEAQLGAVVVCLLPARTDTAWFHNYCTKGDIEFIRGRIKFGGHKNAAPFPSMIVVFHPPK